MSNVGLCNSRLKRFWTDHSFGNSTSRKQLLLGANVRDRLEGREDNVKPNARILGSLFWDLRWLRLRNVALLTRTEVLRFREKSTVRETPYIILSIVSVRDRRNIVKRLGKLPQVVRGFVLRVDMVAEYDVDQNSSVTQIRAAGR